MIKRSVVLVVLMGLSCMSTTVHGGKSDHCGPDREPFDPDKKGCCQKPDGTWILTDNPKNEPDPCSKVPSGGAQGRIICYNGIKYICVYSNNFPSAWKPPNASQKTYNDITNCIAQHENVHMGQDIYCPDCTVPAKHRQPDRETEYECDALKDTFDCARKFAYEPGGMEFYTQIKAKLNKMKCTGYPF